MSTTSRGPRMDGTDGDGDRINRYLLRKKSLIEGFGVAFASLTGALVDDLCRELRKYRADVPDAMLVEMFLSDIGIEEEGMEAGFAVNQRYLEHYGLGIHSHCLEPCGEGVIVTLQFTLAYDLLRRVSDELGAWMDLLVQARLHSWQKDIQDVELRDAVLLELADLENLVALLRRHWPQLGGDLGTDGIPRSALVQFGSPPAV